MKILALDLGSTLGYAIGVNETIKKHGYEQFTRDYEGRSSFSNESFSDFLRWLGPVVKQVDIVVCERPHSHYSSFHALRVLFGMYGIVQAACGGFGKSLLPVGSTEVKKFWTGKGNAKKHEMIANASKRGFKSVEDHNQCDALANYLFYWEVLRGKSTDNDDPDEQIFDAEAMGDQGELTEFTEGNLSFPH